MADDSSDNEDDGVVALFSTLPGGSTVGYNGGRVRVRFLIFTCVHRPSKTMTHEVGLVSAIHSCE